MSQQTQPGETCEECRETILEGQSICRLFKAVFHAGCLIKWCEARLKRRTDLANTLKETL